MYLKVFFLDRFLEEMDPQRKEWLEVKKKLLIFHMLKGTAPDLKWNIRHIT